MIGCESTGVVLEVGILFDLKVLIMKCGNI